MMTITIVRRNMVIKIIMVNTTVQITICVFTCIPSQYFIVLVMSTIIIITTTIVNIIHILFHVLVMIVLKGFCNVELG